jgi:teichuronic acid biosynthesis glycosyltransferase TuaH
MILFLSDIPWEALYQRPQHLAGRLAGSERVLWVEPATIGRPVYFQPDEIVPGVFRLTLPALPLNAKNPVVRFCARAITHATPLLALLLVVQERLVLRAMRSVGEGEWTALVENFQLIPLLEKIRASRVVFDYIDDAFGFTAYPPLVTAWWHAAIRRADAITATSPTLARRLEEAGAASVRVIPNGVAYARFAAAQDSPRPPDLPPAGTPVIIYVGSLYPWIDFPLLEALAGMMPDARIVLLGHVHPAVRGELDRLCSLANVSFLGHRPHEAIPAYLTHADVGIVPFRRTRLTEGVNPVKLYEYSAAGLTTVATDFSDDMRQFSPFVLIAASPGEFADGCRAALGRRNDPAAVNFLRAFARENDWDMRATAFAQLLHPPRQDQTT